MTSQVAHVFRYASRYKLGWIVIVLVTVMWSFVAILVPFPLKVVVDQAIGGQPPSDPFGSLLATLPGGGEPMFLIAYATFASLVIFGANAALEATATVAWIRVGHRMVYDVARDVFAALQRRSITFHSTQSVGDSVSRIAGDSWSANTVMDTLIVAPGHAILTIALMVVVMASMDVRLTLIAIVLAPLMVLATALLGPPTRRVARAQRDIEGNLHAHVQQVLAGLPVVRSFGQEEREQSRFRAMSSEAVRAHERGSAIGSLATFSGGLVTAIGTAVILLFGAEAVLDGTMTTGALLVFIAYLTALQAQFKALSGVYIGLQVARGGLDRVAEVLDAPPEIVERPGAPALPPVRGHVRIEGVVFGYEPGRAVLRGVRFEARPGETVALVGASGAGKSTLASLVPRLVDPWLGRVTIDGHDVREVSLRSVREQVAVVLQEPFLFPITIAENIAYGRPGASRGDIEAAAGAADAHGFIERLPAGYETIVGERGATLSGGERQRLSIARALLKDAPILDARRAHLRPRRRHRDHAAAGARAAHGRPHHARHRPPPLDGPPRRPHRRPPRGSRRRERHPRRAPRGRRPLRLPLPHPVPR